MVFSAILIFFSSLSLNSIFLLASIRSLDNLEFSAFNFDRVSEFAP